MNGKGEVYPLLKHHAINTYGGLDLHVHTLIWELSGSEWFHIRSLAA